jgi:hypothetical protein
MSPLPHSVGAGRSLPIDNGNQFPGVTNEIPFQLTLLIDHQLGFRVQKARALGFILVVQVQFANRQVVGGRSVSQ